MKSTPERLRLPMSAKRCEKHQLPMGTSYCNLCAVEDERKEVGRLQKAITEALAAYRHPHSLSDTGRLSAIVSILGEVERDDPNVCQHFKNMRDDETFTIAEMREAYSRYLHGLPLTDKQRLYADAKRAVVRECCRDAALGLSVPVMEEKHALQDGLPRHPWVRRAMSRANCFFQTIRAGKPKNGSTSGP